MNEVKDNYLIKNGWTKSGELWKNPNGNQYVNGYSLNSALIIQAENDMIDKRGVCYRAIPNFFGFGYDIRGRVSKKSHVFNKWINCNFPTVADAHKLTEKLNGGEEIPKHSANFNYSKILVLHEGMDVSNNLNKYYYVPNFTVFGKIALKVILERDIIGQGYWYDFTYPEKPTAPAVSREEGEKYPFQKDRDNVTTSWNKYEIELKEWYRNIRMKRLFDKIKKEKSPIDAAFFLHERKTESFEGYNLVNAEKVFS